MATWRGDPKKFEVERGPTDPNSYDSIWGEVDFRWEYNTTSDTLSIFVEHPDIKTRREYMGPDWAKAYLYTLANYYKTYVGREQLKELLKDLLEE